MRKIRVLAAAASIVAASMAGSAASAEGGLCETRSGPLGAGHLEVLCPLGPAECIAYGLLLAVDPMPGAPAGASTHLARSQAVVHQDGFGFSSEANSSTQRASLPPALGEGLVESACFAATDAQWPFAFNQAHGSAEATRLSIDLSSYGVPVSVSANVLQEKGFGIANSGGNAANVSDIVVTTAFGPAVAPQSAAPNTTVALPGGLGTLYVNEQSVSTINGFGCLGYAGDAARLVVSRPGIGGSITLILSWVATAGCDQLPPY